VPPVANSGDGKKGVVSGPPGKKQKDPPTVEAGNEKRRMKQLPKSSRRKGQGDPMEQQPDLPATNTNPINPCLGGWSHVDHPLEDFYDADFPPNYNYQSVLCVKFYNSKKNHRGAVVKFGQQLEFLYFLLADLFQHLGLADVPAHRTWAGSLHNGNPDANLYAFWASMVG